MIKVVLDTNIYISGILFTGNPRIILDLAIKGRIKVCISSDIITEIKDVLSRKKFGFPTEIIETIIREIESVTTLITPSKKYKVVSRDNDGNIIIDCAAEAHVDYIITGDNDLLSLNNYNAIRIINPTEFIEMYKHSHL